MTTQMIIALAITALMVILIMQDKLPFGTPPLLACLLLVVFGIADIKAAFAGFSNATIIMLAEFMAIIAALQKTSFIARFKETMFNMANKGGIKAYIMMILVVMLGCSLFGTGSTAYYVMVIGLLSTLPYSKKLPPSKIIMTAGFAANHPLIPFNTALQYGIVLAVLGSAGVAADVSVAKFAVVNFFLSMGFLANCLIQYKFLPDHPIAAATEEAKAQGTSVSTLPKWKEQVTYIAFVVAVVGMILQGKIGDAGYAIAGLSVGAILVAGVMDFKEIRDAISAPIILMSAGVIGVADALGSTGLTDLVGSHCGRYAGRKHQSVYHDLRFLHPDQCSGHYDRFHHRYRLCIRSSGHRHLHKPWPGSHSRCLRHCRIRLVRTLPSHRWNACYGHGCRRLQHQGILEIHDPAVLHPSAGTDRRFPDHVPNVGGRQIRCQYCL